MDTLKKLTKVSIECQFLLMKSKKKLTNMKNCGVKIKYLIRSMTKISNDYDKKYIKIKFNSDNELLLNKKQKLHDNNCQSCFS